MCIQHWYFSDPPRELFTQLLAHVQILISFHITDQKIHAENIPLTPSMQKEVGGVDAPSFLAVPEDKEDFK